MWWYQILATPAQKVADTSSVNAAQHQRHRDSGSTPASGSRYLSLLAKQAQQKLSYLWSSGTDNVRSGEGDVLGKVS